MLYSISEIVKYSIILAVVIVAAVIILLALAGYKTFSQMFGIYSKSYVMRGNKSRDKQDKIASDSRSQAALEAAEDAKKLFFTDRISGSTVYLPDILWAKKPVEYEQDFDKQKIYAYFFCADDFEIKNSYTQESGSGRHIEEATSNKYAIVLHGYDQCGLDNYKIAFEFMRRGFNVLSPDLTGHGKDDNKFVSYGYRDRLYVKKWIEFILSHDDRAEIYLYGVSMGAATALYTLGEELPSNIKGCISDCSFASIYDECVKQFKKRKKLPTFPIMNTVVLFGKMLLHYNIKKVSVKEAVEKNENVPILFFHGEDDRFVTPDRAQTLYTSAKSKKQLVLYEQTRHAESMILNYGDYWKNVDEFIENTTEEVKDV